MSFPETRPTLIHRLASFHREEDWKQFLEEYWGPVFRFALRWGARGEEEAEDVATDTFEILWTNRLLVRWASNRSSKLRTLLCAVVRKVLSGRHRAALRREELVSELIRHLDDQSRLQTEPADQFYAAWVEEILRRALHHVTAAYCAEGKANYLRVLHGRLCQGLTLAALAALAELLHIALGEVDNQYRHARTRLTAALQDEVRQHVTHFCLPEEVKDEFQREWQTLGAYLERHGGLEQAVAGAPSLLLAASQAGDLRPAIERALERLTARKPPEG